MDFKTPAQLTLMSTPMDGSYQRHSPLEYQAPVRPPPLYTACDEPYETTVEDLLFLPGF